jgi:transcriptional regulator with XRE-family HTH domain
MSKSTIGQGRRLREARKAAGYTQVALAKEVGVAQSAISDLERGESRTMDDSTLLGLTRVLRVRPEWLKYGEAPMRIGEDDASVLLAMFSRLSEANKAALLAAAEALARSQNQSPATRPDFPRLPPPQH